MAQYWHQIQTSADLNAFTYVLGDGTMDFFDDGGTPVLRLVTGTDFRHFIRFDAAGTSVSNMQVAVYGRQTVTDLSRVFGPLARANTASQASNEFYIVNAYGSVGTSVQLQSSDLANTTTTVLASDLGVLSSSSTNYNWYILDVNGTTIKGSGFTAGPTELGNAPDPYQMSVTNSDVTNAGYAGIFGWRDAADIYVHIISIGTDGDPAPTGPVGATIPTLSAPGVTEIGSTSVRPQITLTF